MRKKFPILTFSFVVLILIVSLSCYSLAQGIIADSKFQAALSKLRENISELRMLNSDLAEAVQNPESPNFCFIALSVAEIEMALIRCNHEIDLLELTKSIKTEIRPFYVECRIDYLKILTGFLSVCINDVESNDTMIKKEEALRLTHKAKKLIKSSIGVVEEIIEALESGKKVQGLQGQEV